MIFPETVFNSSASHLAAYLGSAGVNYTLVGDAGTFLQGLAVGGGMAGQRPGRGLCLSLARRSRIGPSLTRCACLTTGPFTPAERARFI